MPPHLSNKEVEQDDFWYPSQLWHSMLPDRWSGQAALGITQESDLLNLRPKPDLLNENLSLNQTPRWFLCTLESVLEPSGWFDPRACILPGRLSNVSFSCWPADVSRELTVVFLERRDLQKVFIPISPVPPFKFLSTLACYPAKLEEWAAKCILKLFTSQTLHCLPFQKRTGPRGPSVSWADSRRVIFLKTQILCFLDNSGKSVADTLTVWYHNELYFGPRIYLLRYLYCLVSINS